MEVTYNMAIQWNLRRLLDRKVWEAMTPTPVTTAAGHFVITDPVGLDRMVLYFAGASSVWRYDHDNDAWQQLPNSGLGGTHGAGSCGTFHLNGPSGTATGGSTTTINTNLNIPSSLEGYRVFITSGPNAGETRTIISNTYGANSILTVDVPYSTNITTSSTYLLRTGRFYIITAGIPGFRFYDRATNTWSSNLSVSGFLGAVGTDSRLTSTETRLDDIFVSGTATGGSATTLIDSTKNWATNQWTNYQVRIVSGSAAGRIATILSNTSNTLTLSSGLAISNNSGYIIEGNDDFLYYSGSASTTFYRYSISGNSWTTLATIPAAPGAGMGLNWVSHVEDPSWSDESGYLNGRYIYCIRGAASATIYRYSIPSNTWETLNYNPQVETFTTGSSWDYDGNYLYGVKDSTNRLFRFDIVKNRLFPLSTLVYPESTAVTGDKLWTKRLVDGDTTIIWVYKLRNSGTELFRMMLIDNYENTSNGGWSIVEI